MSRTGKKPIDVPDKVKVHVEPEQVRVEGPLGKLSQATHQEIKVELKDKQVLLTRENDDARSRSLHGLMRSLINNMVVGVSTGFKKELDIQGVGYRAEVKGKVLNLSLGFSHPVIFPIPEGIQIKVDKQTHVEITGYDKVQVGQVAADIRKIRPPEPYKGKGVRYSDEVILRKAGKSASSGK